jgi:Secreted repeat of unknown function
VTYNGHPLCLFASDTASHQINGEGSDGFGAPWYVLSPRGDAVTGPMASSPVPHSAATNDRRPTTVAARA